LGVVVALNFDWLSLRRTPLVCLLSLHDLWRSHPKAFPLAVATSTQALAERNSGEVGRMVFIRVICPNLLMEELWDLENTAYLSACLLLLITAGAMIFSAIFERRFWCRYLCPIGGMNGLFAKLSMTELRAQQGTCSAECTTYQCYKGGPQKGEGLATLGCPLYSHPAQLEDNRDCVLCMTCLKACPHRSVEVNLRPPGIELWTTHVPRTYEVALLLLLLGVYLSIDYRSCKPSWDCRWI
jgi:polyferredoxin